MTPWPRPDDFHIWTLPILPGYTLDVQIWSSYSKAFERHTDRQVTRGHFWSCDRNGGHTVGSAIPKNPMLHTIPKTLIFYRTGVVGYQILHCGNRHFGCFRLLWPWRWPNDLHMQTASIVWRYTRCTKMKFLHQGFLKLLSDRHTYIHTHVQTELTEIINHVASQVVTDVVKQ